MTEPTTESHADHMLTMPARDALRTPGPWDIIGGCDWTVDTDSSNTFVHIGPIDGDPVAIAIVADCWCMEILPWMERHLTSEQKVALNLGWQDYHDQEVKP